MSYGDHVLNIWASNAKCYASHNKVASFVVSGGGELIPSCGNHISPAIREICQKYELTNVTVWCKP